MALIKRAAASLLAFVVVTAAVTELLQGRIYFSLFVGIPAGATAALLTLYITGQRHNNG